MSRRARVVQYVVQPVIVTDDGENLTPLDVKPITVAAAQWEQFAAVGLAEALAQLQATVEAEHPQA